MSLIKTYKEQPKYKPSALAYDYTGAKYGDLTVLHAIGVEGAHTMWRAKCKCGTEVKVRSHQLANGAGRITSCGKCRHLPRYNLMDLPSPLVDDGDKPEQIELPLETEIDELFNGPEEKPTRTIRQAAEAKRPWRVAEQCVDLLEELDDEARLKALSLIKVQLGYIV